jgi:S1-C subfamily serine protease
MDRAMTIDAATITGQGSDATFDCSHCCRPEPTAYKAPPTSAMDLPVFRITVMGTKYNWLEPAIKGRSTGGTGTGFAVHTPFVAPGPDAFHIITAYHVVAHAVGVHVHVKGKSAKGVVVCCNPDLDVALVRVEAKMPAQTKAYHVANSDEIDIKDAVEACGFALGKSHLQITTGVVSGRTALHLQTSAPINPGNSGGPLLNDNGHVIGIVVSGYPNAQNVSNACPINEAIASLQRTIQRVPNGAVAEPGTELSAAVLAGAPRPPFECCPDLNARLRPNPTGIGMVCVASHHPPNRPGLHVDDVVTHIAGLELADDGTVAVPFWAFPLHWKALLTRCREGGHLDLTLLCAGGASRVLSVPIGKPLDASRLWYPELDPIPFCTLGGLVVQPLSLNLLRLPNILAKYGGILASPAAKMTGVLVVTHISPSSPFVERESDLVQVFDQITYIEMGAVMVDLTSGTGLMRKYTDVMQSAARRAAQGVATTVELHLRDGRRVRVSVDADAGVWAARGLVPALPRAPVASAPTTSALFESANQWAVRLTGPSGVTRI